MSKKNRPQPNKNPNYVIDPKTKIAGKTQAELADDWWKYQQSISQEENPAFDRNGDFAGINQSGDVYILPGTSNYIKSSPFDGKPDAPVSRKIVVPQGKILFIPIIGEANSGNNIIDPPTYVDTSKNFINADLFNYDKLDTLTLSIDGKVVLDKVQAKEYRQRTPDTNGFSFNTPESSVYAGTKYDNAFLAQSFADGYYVGLNALPPGKHNISFKATMKNGATQDISYEIDIKPLKEIQGNDKNNNLKGTWGDDDIDAFGGDDTVYAYGGNDIIDGWAGNDTIYAGDGNDIVYGGAGNDKLYGESGNDVVAGGVGDDTIDGGWGNDRLYGGSGKDNIKAGDGDDKVFGGSGNDTIDGGKGNDIIDAVAHADLVLPYTLIATDFSKVITPGKGEIDTIKGGAGRDTFVLGTAGDAKVGVNGSKYYIGGKDADYALIQDFQLGSSGDKIQLFGSASDYSLQNVTLGGTSGVGIYAKDATGANDLVALVQVQGGSPSSLSLGNTNQFNFVS